MLYSDDKKKFYCLESDPTILRETRLKDYLKQLYDKDKINKQLYNKLRPMGSNSGSLYGLP